MAHVVISHCSLKEKSLLLSFFSLKTGKKAIAEFLTNAVSQIEILGKPTQADALPLQ